MFFMENLRNIWSTIVKNMVNKRQQTSSTIVKTHCQQSSKTWSHIIKKHGQQSSNNHQTSLTQHGHKSSNKHGQRHSGTSSTTCTSSTSTGMNSLKQSFVKKRVCELVWFLRCCPRNVWGQELFVFQKKLVTTYKWHQLSGLSVLIFRGGRHGGQEKTREGPEHGNQCKTWTFLKCVHIQKVTNDGSKAWCILNEKMMPDMTITIPELEINTQQIGHQYF
jgi:hypothetical protein